MKQDQSIQDSRSGFPISISKAQLREDILNIYLLQVRTTALVVPEGLAWPIAGPQKVPQLGQLWNPDLTAEAYGISYGDIHTIKLARVLEQQYDFGFLGLVTEGFEPMEYETMHMWVAAYLMDLRGSEFVSEWESYGASVDQSVLRCLQVCELANARLTLEDREPFSYFSSLDNAGRKARKSDAEGATSLDGLTVRQMALLSGMEEMTIRTAASRPGPNQLPTFKDENRRTLIKPEDARRWLKVKGRYVEVAAHPDSVDLAKVKVRTVDEFNDLVLDRIRHLAGTGIPFSRTEAAIAETMRAHGFQPSERLARPMLLNESLMAQVAGTLQLPPQLLLLRARQAALHDELNELDVQIRQAAAPAVDDAQPAASDA